MVDGGRLVCQFTSFIHEFVIYRLHGIASGWPIPLVLPFAHSRLHVEVSSARTRGNSLISPNAASREMTDSRGCLRIGLTPPALAGQHRSMRAIFRGRTRRAAIPSTPQPARVLFEYFTRGLRPGTYAVSRQAFIGRHPARNLSRTTCADGSAYAASRRENSTPGGATAFDLRP
jgi:hypothetical protein